MLENISVHRKLTDQNSEFPINFVLQDRTTNQLLTEIKVHYDFTPRSWLYNWQFCKAAMLRYENLRS